MLFYVLGFTVLMVFDTLAQISFKLAAIHAMPLQADLSWIVRVFSHPWIYGALIGYLGSFFTWITLLRRVPIGPAFAASYLEVISILICSVWLFHEPITAARAGGAVMIVLGIVCLAKAESDLASSPD